MSKTKQRSGGSLVLAGIAGAAFFVLTDPRYPAGHANQSPDIVEAIHQAIPGTYVGVGGCIFVTLIGLWLLMRRVA